jgi:hypothetical protein
MFVFGEKNVYRFVGVLGHSSSAVAALKKLPISISEDVMLLLLLLSMKQQVALDKLKKQFIFVLKVLAISSF